MKLHLVWLFVADWPGMLAGKWDYKRASAVEKRWSFVGRVEEKFSEGVVGVKVVVGVVDVVKVVVVIVVELVVVVALVSADEVGFVVAVDGGSKRHIHWTYVEVTANEVAVVFVGGVVLGLDMHSVVSPWEEHLACKAWGRLEGMSILGELEGTQVEDKTENVHIVGT